MPHYNHHSWHAPLPVRCYKYAATANTSEIISPQWLHIIHVANQYLMINSCSEMFWLEEIYAVEVCYVDAPNT